MAIRTTLRDVVACLVSVSGYNVIRLDYDAGPALAVAGRIHYYSAECTYVDLVVVVMPFLWVIGGGRVSNITRMGIAAFMILGGNVVRCWLSVYLGLRGVERLYAHDLPDYILWWPTAVIVPLLALRRDLGGRSEPTSKPRVLEPEMSMRADETFASVAEG